MKAYIEISEKANGFCVIFDCDYLLSPLILIIALMVRINLGSPVIFKQERPGLNEKIFTLYKLEP